MLVTTPSAALPTTNHASGRQRREGSRPSGTSSSASVSSALATAAIQTPSTAATVPSPRRPPAAGRVDAIAYPIATPSTPTSRPYPLRIQPKGESGRRRMTSAPAVDRARNPSVVTTRSKPSPIFPNVRSTKETTHSSSETLAIVHATRAAVRLFISRGPWPVIVHRPAGQR